MADLARKKNPDKKKNTGKVLDARKNWDRPGKDLLSEKMEGIEKNSRQNKKN